jgi:hypothetical protein
MTTSSAGSAPAGMAADALKEGANGGTRGSPVS